jgi:hypothetical protein
MKKEKPVFIKLKNKKEEFFLKKKKTKKQKITNFKKK